MKSLFMMTAILTGILASNASLAEPQQHGDCHNRMPPPQSLMGELHPREMMKRTFTPDQIQTLIEARLIMAGNSNLKLGSITPLNTGYEVTIVTLDNSLVETLELAPNGMPKKLFDEFQARKSSHMNSSQQAQE